MLEGLLRARGAFTGVARGMLDNFRDLVEQFGFVPNGSRCYYLNRSQPPLLAQMLRVYIEHTGDATVLDRFLPTLVKEHAFWTRNRSVSIRKHTLARYAVENTQPRPESYREDLQTATNTTPSDRAALYASLASAAESGWDFSSRWLASPFDSSPLPSLRTPSIIPVDLNAILYANERAIAAFAARQHQPLLAANFTARARARRNAMSALLWDPTHYSYFDYNLTARARAVFVPQAPSSPPGAQPTLSPSQFFPFWLGATPPHLRHASSLRRAYARIAAQLDAQPGGVPASQLETGQQWDAPNVWAPLQYVLIQGLRGARSPRSRDEGGEEEEEARDYAWTQRLARRLAERFVASAFCTWRATGGGTGKAGRGVMFEKYAANATDAVGGGGEYAVEEGFGWTNGVVIWAADVFGRELGTPECGETAEAGEKTERGKRSAVEVSGRDEVCAGGGVM